MGPALSGGRCVVQPVRRRRIEPQINADGRGYEKEIGF
jgi:hypothetical protein